MLPLFMELGELKKRETYTNLTIIFIIPLSFSYSGWGGVCLHNRMNGLIVGTEEKSEQVEWSFDG